MKRHEYILYNMLSNILNPVEILESFLNDSPVCISICNLEGKIIYVNQMFEKVYGCSSYDVIGQILPCIPPAKYQESLEVIQAICSGLPVTTLDTERLGNNGTIFPASVTFSPIKNKHGAIMAILIVERDISERKASEKRLIESEERHRQLVELSPEPIIVMNDLTIVYVNPAAISFLGAKRSDQVLGQTMKTFVHESSAALISNMLAERCSSQLMELSFLRLDRESRDVELIAMPIVFAGNPSVQLLCRDITDRKQSEQRQREVDQQFRKLLKLLPEPILVLRDEEIFYINDACLLLLGIPREEQIIGSKIFDFIHPDFHGQLRERQRALRSSGVPGEHMELKVLKQDRSIVDVEVSEIYIPNYLGAPVFQYVIRDLTERKRTQEWVRRSEKLSLAGQFAAGVAHEIRNPLTSLKGFAQLLRQRNDSKTAFYLDIMLEELERINGIVNEFMVLAKPQPTTFEEKRIFPLVENVISIIQPQAVLYNIVLNLVSDELGDIRVKCDENQIKQVIINLAKNAIESMADGGTIDITIKRPDEGHVTVQIQDQGTGIPEDQLQRLGEPFFSNKENGTGLGLMICYRIIEAHRGTMQIQSKLNRGTRVDITLPVS